LSTLAIMACAVVLAQGIGVSPDRLDLQPGEAQTLWLTNPNQHTIAVKLESDCPDIALPEELVRLEPLGRIALHVAASSHTEGCSGFLTVSLVEDRTDGISILPAVQLPLELAASVKTYEIRNIAPAWSQQPQSSRLKGLLFSASIIIVGILAYFASQRFSISFRQRV
jgi:hypothetical protein